MSPVSDTEIYQLLPEDTFITMKYLPVYSVALFPISRRFVFVYSQVRSGM